MNSIEWFYNELIEHKIIKKENHFSFVKNFATTYELLFEQAKEMHEQEIIDAWSDGSGSGQFTTTPDTPEQYYQETFKQPKKIQ